jgi:hypothetical protein
MGCDNGSKSSCWSDNVIVLVLVNSGGWKSKEAKGLHISIMVLVR